jgi:hypothetical protein
MKKSDLWKKYAERNPSFSGDGNVTLSARGLRKLFDQTWDIAFFEGEPEQNEAPPRADDTEALEKLKSIFGF